MSTSNILCVTNRKLCNEKYLTQIERIVSCNPAGIIVREKDLTSEEYRHLASQVLGICREYQVPCILHHFINEAKELEADAIHLPLPELRNMTYQDKKHFSVIGASCHSIEDAIEAEKLGCSYITAGHIFNTDCKQGIPGRGLDFLRQVCAAVSIPVYAIGGIDRYNISSIYEAGAAGGCVMSLLMNCENVYDEMKHLYDREHLTEMLCNLE